MSQSLLTIHDIARITGRSLKTVRNLPASKLPPVCKIPGVNRRLWRPEDVDAWLAGHVITQQAQHSSDATEILIKPQPEHQEVMKEADPELKIAVHGAPWITARGMQCLKHREWWVVMGLNPLGPRGGHSGIAVGSCKWFGRYGTREAALKKAQELSRETGAPIV